MAGFVQDKVVVITGSGSGIGREFALAFGRAGAMVVVNDLARDTEGKPAALRVAEEIVAAGGGAGNGLR